MVKLQDLGHKSDYKSAELLYGHLGDNKWALRDGQRALGEAVLATEKTQIGAPAALTTKARKGSAIQHQKAEANGLPGHRILII